MKRPSLRVYLSDSYDPWFNLATEDWIFRDMDPHQHVLFLWRNSETVVIGRFQNPWTECQVAKMEQDGVKLARRQSGGGAVFHDLGNTNFTFMSGRELYDKTRNNRILLEALKSVGVEARASGRNDLVIEDQEGERKFSGSAFKENRDRCFHHGTLLIKANLARLGDYLTPHAKKLTSKGIRSVRARVVNLSELVPTLEHQILCDRVIESFAREYGDQPEVIHLQTGDLEKIEKLQSYYQKLKDWNWRFGETPEFNHQMGERLSFGQVDVHLDVHKGLVTEAVLFSDSLHPEMIEYLTLSLKKRPYTESGLKQAVADSIKELPMLEQELTEFGDWLIGQIQ